MTTSLASQLNALKIQQRDEIALPSRLRLSFLFDSKTAATIDDQALYYIALAGCKQVEQLCPLDAFMSEILSEKSLSFYRGTQTKDTLEVIDQQLEVLIDVLAPHFLANQGTLKILEYLIRIYDVHVYQK